MVLAAVAAVLLVLAILWAMDGEDPMVVQTATQVVPTPTSSVPGSSDPVPTQDEVVVAEGLFEGSSFDWFLTAWESGDGTICARLGGMGCFSIPEGGHLSGLFITEDVFPAGQPGWCGYGTVKGADSVRLDLTDSTEADAAVYSSPEFDVDFFVHCQMGDSQSAGVAALAADGTVLEEMPNPDAETILEETTTSAIESTLPDRRLLQTWDDGLVFGESMPWALAFDNGTCCIKTVTLDGDGSHLVNIGTQGGDQPFRLTLHDGRLVVSWGDIYAYDIATGTSTLLAEATFHLPASDPSNVWMIGYPGPRISALPPEVWQVDVTTGHSTEPKLLESDGFVARGIAGGLALDSDNGILLWDYETGEVVDSFGEGLSIVSDVTEDGRIAWCSEPCFEMVVTSLADGEQTVYSRPEDELHPYGIGAARFSHDGRYLAAPAGNDVMLIDTATGKSRPTMAFPDETAPHLYVAWAPNNTDLFAADYSYGAAESVIGHYSLVDDTAEVTTLPHGGTLSFVVLPSSETGSLVP
jgi:hypothetical protein